MARRSRTKYELEHSLVTEAVQLGEMLWSNNHPWVICSGKCDGAESYQALPTWLESSVITESPLVDHKASGRLPHTAQMMGN